MRRQSNEKMNMSKQANIIYNTNIHNNNKNNENLPITIKTTLSPNSRRRAENTLKYFQSGVMGRARSTLNTLGDVWRPKNVLTSSPPSTITSSRSASLESPPSIKNSILDNKLSVTTTSSAITPTTLPTGRTARDFFSVWSSRRHKAKTSSSSSNKTDENIDSKIKSKKFNKNKNQSDNIDENHHQKNGPITINSLNDGVLVDNSNKYKNKSKPLIKTKSIDIVIHNNDHNNPNDDSDYYDDVYINDMDYDIQKLSSPGKIKMTRNKSLDIDELETMGSWTTNSSVQQTITNNNNNGMVNNSVDIDDDDDDDDDDGIQLSRSLDDKLHYLMMSSEQDNHYQHYPPCVTGGKFTDDYKIHQHNVQQKQTRGIVNNNSGQMDKPFTENSIIKARLKLQRFSSKDDSTIKFANSSKPPQQHQFKSNDAVGDGNGCKEQQYLKPTNSILTRQHSIDSKILTKRQSERNISPTIILENDEQPTAAAQPKQQQLLTVGDADEQKQQQKQNNSLLQCIRPRKKLSFREPIVTPKVNVMEVKSDTLPRVKKSIEPLTDMHSAICGGGGGSRLKRVGSMECELESQAMRVVRTVGQAFEVCNKLNLQKNSLERNNDDHDDRSETPCDLSDRCSEHISEDDDFKKEPILVTPETPLKRPNHLDILPVTNYNNIRKSQMMDNEDKLNAACLPISTSKEIQQLREQLEQQTLQTRQAFAQLMLVREQLITETNARIEAQARTQQLLQQNRELLEHLTSLGGYNESDRPGLTAASIGLAPQLSSSAKVARWFQLNANNLASLSRPESGFVSADSRSEKYNDGVGCSSGGGGGGGGLGSGNRSGGGTGGRGGDKYPDDLCDEYILVEGANNLWNKLPVKKRKKLLGLRFGKVTTF